MRTKQTNEKQMNEHVTWQTFTTEEKESILDPHIAYMTFTPIASACPPILVSNSKVISQLTYLLGLHPSWPFLLGRKDIFLPDAQWNSEWWSPYEWKPQVNPPWIHSYVHMHDLPPPQVFCSLWYLAIVHPSYQCLCRAGVIFVCTVANITDTLDGFIW